MKRTVKIDRLLISVQKTTDNDFWFSSNIRDWQTSKRKAFNSSKQEQNNKKK